MDITDEMDKKQYFIKRRALKLFELPLNISTTFRCSAYGDDKHKDTYKDISFRVKGDEVKITG